MQQYFEDQMKIPIDSMIMEAPLSELYQQSEPFSQPTAFDEKEKIKGSYWKCPGCKSVQIMLEKCKNCKGSI